MSRDVIPADHFRRLARETAQAKAAVLAAVSRKRALR